MQQVVSALVGQYATEPLQHKGMLSKVESCCCLACRDADLNGFVLFVQQQLTNFFTASTELLDTQGRCNSLSRRTLLHTKLAKFFCGLIQK